MIFWRMLVTKQVPVAIDVHSIFFHTMEVNGGRRLFGYNIHQNAFNF